LVKDETTKQKKDRKSAESIEKVAAIRCGLWTAVHIQ